jgi:hypothetical protein
MTSLSIQGLGLSASCPGRTNVNTDVTFEGTIGYNLVNEGDADLVVNIVAGMHDSAGHNTADSRTFETIRAGQSARFDHLLRLAASYDQVGMVTVTAQLSVEGDLTFSDSTFCEFPVEQF